MSQSGLIDIEAANPQIPTMFVTDSGTAIPLANILEILGIGGITTSAVGNIVTIDGSGVSSGIVTIDGDTGSVTGTIVTLTGGATGLAFGGVATTLTMSGILLPASGGTGINNGTRTITLGSGTTGDVLTRDGSGNAAWSTPSAGGIVTINGDAGSVTGTTVTLTGGATGLTFTGVTSTMTMAGTLAVTHGGTGAVTLTNHGVLLGQGTSPIVATAVGATGTVLAGNTGADPTFQALSGIVTTSITATAPLTANGTSGTPQTGAVTVALTTPLALNFGGTNANLTASNGGIFYSTATAGAILAGTATARQMLQSGANAAPAWSTTVWPATSTINQILFSSAANTVTGLATANSATLVTTSAGVPVFTGSMTNGQLVIGSTSATPTVGTITSTGGTITVTLGAGTINLDLAGGTTAIDSIHPDSGTDPVVPTAAGLVNIQGSGSTTTVGSLNTLTVQLTGLTNHAVLVGAGTTTITKVGPSANTGQVLQNNAAADPSYSTATYPSTATGTGTILRADGTNWAATTSTYPNTNAINTLLYASSANVMSALATANNGTLITSATGVPSWLAAGTTGQVLTATTGSPPSWAAATGTATTVTGQAFTATGAFTYTPTSGMRYVIVELQAAGGGSGGVPAVTAQAAISGGGGAGGYARFILSAAQVGASLTGSVGVAGTAGTAGSNTGGAGGNTTLATTAAWTCTGGAGGPSTTAAATNGVEASFGGTVTTGTGTILNTMTGGQGTSGIAPASVCLGSSGGSCPLGFGGGSRSSGGTTLSSSGYAGTGYGAGGGGAINYGTFSAIAGKAGQNGIAIFTEFS